MVAQLRDIGVAIVGQSAHLVPADKKLYALRDVTATVDIVPLIASSIMSKKLAAGADAIVLDVKVGDGAFMKTLADARVLAEEMIELGRRAGKEVTCLLTDMDQPLGRAVGNALEIREALDTVTRRRPGRLHRARPRRLCPPARVLRSRDRHRRGPPPRRAGGQRRHRPSTSTSGGSARRAATPIPRALPDAPVRRSVPAPATGVVTRVGALAVGIAALELGAGRRTKADTIDHSVGVLCFAKRGDAVLEGDDLAEVHARDEAPCGRRGDCASAAAASAASYSIGGRGVRPSDGHPVSTSSPRRRHARPPRLGACRSSPRSRPSAGRSRRCSRGHASSRSRSATHAWCRPFDPSIVADALVGERVDEVGRRGKYLIVGFESGRSLLVHLRMTGSLRHAPSGSVGRRSAHTRCSQIGQWIGRRLSRRPTLRDVGALRARRARRRTSRHASARSRSDRSRPRGSASGSKGDARRSSRRSSTSGRSRASGTSTSTRRSGRADCIRSRVAGSLDADELGRLYRAVRSVLRKGIERQGSTLRDYALARRGVRHDAARVPRLRTWGRAVRPLRACRSRASSSAGGRRRSARTARPCQSDAGRAASVSSSRPRAPTTRSWVDAR